MNDTRRKHNGDDVNHATCLSAIECKKTVRLGWTSTAFFCSIILYLSMILNLPLEVVCLNASAALQRSALGLINLPRQPTSILPLGCGAAV